MHSRSYESMTFWEHLGELRNRILISLAAIALCSVAAWFFREQLYDILLVPLKQADPTMKLNQFVITEAFFTFIRIAFFSGLVAASPFVLFQLWLFVAPALKPHEKRITKGLVIPVGLLFIAGVVFIYYVLLPISIQFLLSYSNESLELELSQDRYFGFITGLCVAGGVLFELPAVMAVLGWLDLVNARWLLRQSGVALVVLMTVAAIITPTGDAFNMLAFTGPLMGLYLVGVVIVWLIQRFRGNKPVTKGV